jgi:RsiW-degrading membrane proteinase PrsW (M82 family)
MFDSILSLISRVFKRVFNDVRFLYAPVLLVLVFATLLVSILYNNTLWPIPLFSLVLAFIFSGQFKKKWPVVDFVFDITGRFFKRIFKDLFFLYAPVLLILAFAILWTSILHNETLWPIPLFALVLLFVFPNQFKKK